jgi:penicillin-binding protein 1A
VRALTGGLDFAEQEFNAALQAARQPGSAFKTFALAELVAEGYDPDRTWVSGPAEYTVELDDQDDYEVSNYGEASWRELTARDATVSSVNTAYVQLAEELGFDAVTEMATTLGITAELAPYPSTVLGSADVSPLEMAAAYATLGAEGVRRTPHVISRIETRDGEVLYEHEDDGEEVVDPNVAAVVTDVLVDVVRRGTGTAAQVDGHPVAGKTGTTNESRDAWFVGYTPALTTAVWVGNLDFSSMGDVTGGSYPAAIFGGYLSALLDGTEPGSFPVPDRSPLEPFDELRPPPPARRPPPPEDDEEDEEEEEEEEEEFPSLSVSAGIKNRTVIKTTAILLIIISVG